MPLVCARRHGDGPPLREPQPPCYWCVLGDLGMGHPGENFNHHATGVCSDLGMGHPWEPQPPCNRYVLRDLGMGHPWEPQPPCNWCVLGDMGMGHPGENLNHHATGVCSETWGWATPERTSTTMPLVCARRHGDGPPLREPQPPCYWCVLGDMGMGHPWENLNHHVTGVQYGMLHCITQLFP